MYVTRVGVGVGLNATLKKKHREQDYRYAISSQRWVCQLEEMGWYMFLRKKK